MSIKQTTNNKPLQPMIHNSSMAIITLVACFVVISLAIGYHWGHYQGLHDAGNVLNSSQNSANSEENSVSLYQGPVIGIEGNSIEITAKVNKNGVVSEQKVTVNTDNTTIFRKLDISAPSLDPEEVVDEQSGSREQIIELKDIQIGDNIIAEANENIMGKTSFNSYLITVLSTGL